MSLSPSATIKLAREILSQNALHQASSVPYLLAQLSNSLRAGTAAHVAQSMVPRVPAPPSRQQERREERQSILSPEDFDRMVREASSAALPEEGPAEDGPGGGERAPMSSANATYGETPPATVRSLLSALTSSEYMASYLPAPSLGAPVATFEGSFVDAGSGNGIATACAASTGQFKGVCRGIEYDPSRHRNAVRLGDAYGRTIGQGREGGSGAQLQFECADLREESFDGSSVVLANCVVWDSELCGAIGQRLDDAEMIGPSVVITISKRVPSPSFDLVDILTLPCNGFSAFTFYVSQKTAKADPAAAESRGSYALSDSQQMRSLRGENGDLLGGIAKISIENGCDEGMAFLASVGASEPGARALLDNDDVLVYLVERLASKEANSLVTRASASLALRAICDFPVGRRKIALADGVVVALIDSLQSGEGIDCSNDHPAIRANVLDILGQILYDPVGSEAVGSHADIDVLFENVRRNAASRGEFDVVESCIEAQLMRRWCAGESKSLSGFTRNMLRSD